MWTNVLLVLKVVIALAPLYLLYRYMDRCQYCNWIFCETEVEVLSTRYVSGIAVRTKRISTSCSHCRRILERATFEEGDAETLLARMGIAPSYF